MRFLKNGVEEGSGDEMQHENGMLEEDIEPDSNGYGVFPEEYSNEADW